MDEDDIEAKSTEASTADEAARAEEDLPERVQKLADELSRTRDELARYRDQLPLLHELVWDLGELKAERETLVQQLREQADQIDALRREVAATREALPAAEDEGLPGPDEESVGGERPDEESPPEEEGPGEPPAEENAAADEESPPGDPPDEESAAALLPFGEDDDDEPTAVADVLALQRDREHDDEGFEDSVTREADESMKALVVSTRQDETSRSLAPSPEPLALITVDPEPEPETLVVSEPEKLAASEPDQPEPEPAQPEPEPSPAQANLRSEPAEAAATGARSGPEPLAVSQPVAVDEDPKVRARLQTLQIRQTAPREVIPGHRGMLTPIRITLALALLLLGGATIHWLTRSDDGEGTKPRVDARPVKATPPDTGLPDVRAPDLIAAAAPPTTPPRRLTGRARRRHRALLLRATRLIERGKVEQAREVLGRALKLRDDWRVRRLLALSHERTEPLLAVEHLEKGAVHAPPRHRSRLHNSRGRILLTLGQRDAACAAFKAAVAAWPRSVGAKKRLKRFCR